MNRAKSIDNVAGVSQHLRGRPTTAITPEWSRIFDRVKSQADTMGQKE